MIEPHSFGSDLVDKTSTPGDPILADHINNLRAWIKSFAALGLNANTETLSENKVLIDSDAPVQFIDPSASEYSVELPAEGSSNHIFYFVNTSASHDLEIVDDGAATIVTIFPGLAALVLSDGSQWVFITGNVDPANIVDLVNNQSIDGIKTFLDPIVIPNPTASTHGLNRQTGDGRYAVKQQARAVSVEVFKFESGDHEAVVTGDGKASVFIPACINGWNLSRVFARVGSAPSGGALSIQLNNGSHDMLSTPLTIDSGEYSSATAASPAVINPSYDNVSTDGYIRIDIDAANGADGLIVILEFTGDLD